MSRTPLIELDERITVNLLKNLVHVHEVLDAYKFCVRHAVKCVSLLHLRPRIPTIP